MYKKKNAAIAFFQYLFLHLKFVQQKIRELLLFVQYIKVLCNSSIKIKLRDFPIWISFVFCELFFLVPMKEVCLCFSFLTFFIFYFLFVWKARTVNYLVTSCAILTKTASEKFMWSLSNTSRNVLQYVWRDLNVPFKKKKKKE